jgi:hypothetical protein
VAVKGAASAGFKGSVDAATNLRHDGTSDGHVRDEVAVHDVDVQPVGTLLHLAGAVMAEVGEVGAQDGGCDNGGGCHFGGEGRVVGCEWGMVEEEKR